MNTPDTFFAPTRTKEENQYFKQGAMTLPEQTAVELVGQKYTLIPNLLSFTSKEQKEHFQVLAESFNDMPEDRYMRPEHLDKDGRSFRTRRFGRFEQLPQSAGGALMTNNMSKNHGILQRLKRTSHRIH